MRAEFLYDTIHAEPFRPFTISLADGKTFQVTHPDWIGFRQGSRTAAIFWETDRVTLIDVGLITSLDVEPLPKAGKIMGSDEPR